jgi:hypothetical protein
VEDGFAVALMTGLYIFTLKYWIPAFAGMTLAAAMTRWRNAGLAIAALRFALCRAFAGVTEGGQGGRGMGV